MPSNINIELSSTIEVPVAGETVTLEELAAQVKGLNDWVRDVHDKCILPWNNLYALVNDMCDVMTANHPGDLTEPCLGPGDTDDPDKPNKYPPE